MKPEQELKSEIQILGVSVGELHKVADSSQSDPSVKAYLHELFNSLSCLTSKQIQVSTQFLVNSKAFEKSLAQFLLGKTNDFVSEHFSNSWSGYNKEKFLAAFNANSFRQYFIKSVYESQRQAYLCLDVQPPKDTFPAGIYFHKKRRSGKFTKQQPQSSGSQYDAVFSIRAKPGKDMVVNLTNIINLKFKEKGVKILKKIETFLKNISDLDKAKNKESRLFTKQHMPISLQDLIAKAIYPDPPKVPPLVLSKSPSAVRGHFVMAAVHTSQENKREEEVKNTQKERTRFINQHVISHSLTLSIQKILWAHFSDLSLFSTAYFRTTGRQRAFSLLVSLLYHADPSFAQKNLDFYVQLWDFMLKGQYEGKSVGNSSLRIKLLNCYVEFAIKSLEKSIAEDKHRAKSSSSVSSTKIEVIKVLREHLHHLTGYSAYSSREKTIELLAHVIASCEETEIRRGLNNFKPKGLRKIVEFVKQPITGGVFSLIWTDPNEVLQKNLKKAIEDLKEFTHPQSPKKKPDTALGVAAFETSAS